MYGTKCLRRWPSPVHWQRTIEDPVGDTVVVGRAGPSGPGAPFHAAGRRLLPTAAPLWRHAARNASAWNGSDGTHAGRRRLVSFLHPRRTNTAGSRARLSCYARARAGEIFLRSRLLVGGNRIDRERTCWWRINRCSGRGLWKYGTGKKTRANGLKRLGRQGFWLIGANSIKLISVRRQINLRTRTWSSGRSRNDRGDRNNLFFNSFYRRTFSVQLFQYLILSFFRKWRY